MTTPTAVMTELDAINQMLVSIGQAPVNTITSTGILDVETAKLSLDTVLREVLTRGWSFNADFDFGTGDFTVEFHFRQNAASLSTYIFVSTRAKNDGVTGVGGVGFDHVRAGIDDLRIVRQSSVVAQSTATFIPVNDTWYHLAYVRSGTDVFFFVDGVKLGDTIADVSDDLDAASSQPLRVGAFNDDRFGVNGAMAAVRITKGVARYTANFTPPTVFYPTS